MENLQQQFGFEQSVIPLHDMAFRPLIDSNERFPVQVPDHISVTKARFHILYWLKDGRFVLLDYAECVPKQPSKVDDSDVIWSSFSPPTGGLVTPEVAAQFLMQHQLQVPEQLQSVIDQLLKEKKPPPERPFSFWAGKNLLQTFSETTAHEADPIEEAQQLVRWGIQLVQELRASSKDRAHLERRAIPIFSNLLYMSYRVEPAHWWKSQTAIPPLSVNITGLKWPPGAGKVIDSLNELRTGLEALLFVVERPTGRRDTPTLKEVAAAREALQEQAAFIESKVLLIRDELTQLITSESVAATSKPIPIPTEDEFRIFWLDKTIGGTQTEIARIFTQQTQIPKTQGQVSKAISHVEEWHKAGNAIPMPEPPPVRKPKSVDPADIDLGARTDGRTRRQPDRKQDE